MAVKPFWQILSNRNKSDGKRESQYGTVILGFWIDKVSLFSVTDFWAN